jgi:hypothetical protein
MFGSSAARRYTSGAGFGRATSEPSTPWKCRRSPVTRQEEVDIGRSALVAIATGALDMFSHSSIPGTNVDGDRRALDRETAAPSRLHADNGVAPFHRLQITNTIITSAMHAR